MINRGKMKKQFELELKHFEEAHQKSKALYLEAKESLLQGVPLNWMVRWMGSFPISVAGMRRQPLQRLLKINLPKGPAICCQQKMPHGTARSFKDDSA